MTDNETRDRLEREIAEVQKAIVTEDDDWEVCDLAERLANLKTQAEEFHS